MQIAIIKTEAADFVKMYICVILKTFGHCWCFIYRLCPNTPSACSSACLLQPNPAFMPKVVESAYRCPTVELLAFDPPPFSSVKEKELNTLCPVRALHVYMLKQQGSGKVLVYCATHNKRKQLSPQRLSHWIVASISLAYSCKVMQPPKRLEGGLHPSWALFRGVSIQEIYAAVSSTVVNFKIQVVFIHVHDCVFVCGFFYNPLFLSYDWNSLIVLKLFGLPSINS